MTNLDILEFRRLIHLSRNITFGLKCRHIQSHVSSCSLCIRENSQREKYKLQTTEIPDQPFAKVGIDLIVDLDVSHSGNKNILVVLII